MSGLSRAAGEIRDCPTEHQRCADGSPTPGTPSSLSSSRGTRADRMEEGFMATIIAPSTTPYKGIRASRTSPVLVATDGREQSDGALVAGFVMAGAPDALRVLTVVQPLPIVTPEAQLPVSADVIAARRADARRAALHQIERVLGDGAAEASVEVQEGDPARAIAAAAREANAGLIICGLGRHRVVDRVFGEE